MSWILRWIIIAAALVIAAWVVPGIEVDGSDGVVAVLVTAAILGIVNLIVRPILVLLSCGLVIVTLGLFLLVINGLTLWLAAWISEEVFEVGFSVDGFWPAFFGGIIVSIVSFVLTGILGVGDDN
jgi:putative membrane protein